jgi:hypothetical protein
MYTDPDDGTVEKNLEYRFRCYSGTVFHEQSTRYKIDRSLFTLEDEWNMIAVRHSTKNNGRKEMVDGEEITIESFSMLFRVYHNNFFATDAIIGVHTKYEYFADSRDNTHYLGTDVKGTEGFTGFIGDCWYLNY